MAESNEPVEFIGEEDCITPPAIQLVCPSCKQDYNEQEHRPKLLSCDHTVCKACLTKLAPCFECLHCHQQISIIEGEVLTDFAVLHALTRPEASSSTGRVSECSEVDGEGRCSGSLVNKERNTILLDTPKGCDTELLHLRTVFEKDGTRSKESVGKDSIPDDSIKQTSSSPACLPTPELPACRFEVSSQSNTEMVTELLRGQFQEAIDDTTSKIEVLEIQTELLRASKEESVKCVDEEFDHLINMINRRRHLLKNQIGDIYAELKETLEEDSERLNLNLMCLRSLSSHSKVMMKGRTDRLQSTYHQISSEISELQENVEQVTLEAAVCIEFETKDKIKDFERSIRLLGKVQTGANVPTCVKIVEHTSEIGKDSVVLLNISDGSGSTIQRHLWDSKLQCQIYGPGGELIETDKGENKSDDEHSECLTLKFVPLNHGAYCVRVYFCDSELPSCVFDVASL